jgi:ABC-type uncharacterized transport system fused permease/ATPase subunit
VLIIFRGLLVFAKNKLEFLKTKANLFKKEETQKMDLVGLVLENGYLILILFVVVIVLTLLFRGKKTSIKGNTLFIIGDNGSGKTSLLYLVSELIEKNKTLII